MKVTQEKLPASQIGLEIEISAETSQKTYEKVVQNLARTADIPGFRKGKVPRQVLLQRLGSQRIKSAVLEELIQNGIEAAIKQEDIESLGNLQLRSNFEDLVKSYEPGVMLTFSATLDVPPTVELGDYQNLNIIAEETPYDETKVDKWLDDRRKQMATLVPVEDRPAQMGDSVVVDYQGHFATESDEKGEPIPGVQGNNFKVEMEKGRLIEGMVEGMVGMDLEETKDIAAVFPEDYPREDVAGKSVIFTVTMKEIKEKELPELDDEFAEDVSEYATFVELKESLEKRFQEEAADATKKSVHEAIAKALLDICSLDLPESMIQKEVEVMLTQTAMQMQRMGIDVRELFTSENIAGMRENARPEAINRLKQNLIIKEIAKVESIKVEEEAITERMAKVQEELKGRDVDLERLREVVTEELVAEKALNWLQEKSTLELVPLGTLNPPETEEEIEEETLALTEEE